MFDVTSELIAIRKQREQDFISISELLEFIKKHNPQAFYSEIATLLLIKLEPHDIRKTDDELWGNEAFEYWESEHGIKTYIITEDISNKPQSIYGSEFFSVLEEIKTDKQALIFDDTCTAKDYLTDYQNNIFIDRKQIENILGISTLDKEALNNKYQNEIKLAVGMALTRTEEFVRNTDINKSPVGLAERLVMLQQISELQAHIAELEQAKATIQAKAELEKQLEQAKGAESAVDYQNYSIHGHTSDNFCLLFKISKLITEKCDPDNPHSYPNKEQFREYVRKYHSDSKELADAFYKIIIPEKVKNRGRTPQGVETFTGF